MEKFDLKFFKTKENGKGVDCHSKTIEKSNFNAEKRKGSNGNRTDLSP